MSMLIPIRDLNPTRRFSLVTVCIIGVNALVFFGTAASGNLFSINNAEAFHYGAVPCDILNRCPALSHQLATAFPGRSPVLSIFTAMFMHADVLHIGFNMLFLWVFGNNVEDLLGRIRYPIFYIVTGLAAAFSHIALNANSQVPTIGASGAISGVLGAYLLLWPNATVISLVPLGFFFFSVRMRAWVVLGLWFVLQIAEGLAGLGQVGNNGGVAFAAHVGGFVAGMVLIYPFAVGRRTHAPTVPPARDPFG